MGPTLGRGDQEFLGGGPAPGGPAPLKMGSWPLPTCPEAIPLEVPASGQPWRCVHSHTPGVLRALQVGMELRPMGHWQVPGVGPWRRTWLALPL